MLIHRKILTQEKKHTQKHKGFHKAKDTQGNKIKYIEER